MSSKHNYNHLKLILSIGTKIVAVALAYYIAGRLSLLLAIPPGYVSPIWPAAGIGLAGVLLFGYRVCPGIFFGSLFVTLWSSYDSSHLETFYGSSGLACSIASGAVLQAFFGTYLIRRFVHFPNVLEGHRDILYFFLLGAPVSCLVNATIGVSTLIISGSLELEKFWFSWFTWWVGDAIGVLVFTPLILILYLNNGQIWKRRKVTIAIPLCLLFALVVLFFIKARSWEQQKIDAEFYRTSKTITTSLEKSIHKYMEVLFSTKSLYVSSDVVTKDEFSKFVNRALIQNPGIQAISWNPIVKNSDLASFEKELSLNGDGSFEFKEKNENGLIVNVKSRKEYVVVVFIEPFEKNKKALGYDVASDAIRLEALHLARDSGQPVATHKISLIQGVKKLNGLIIFFPVYINGKPDVTLEEKRNNITGYIAGVFKIEGMIETAIDETIESTNEGIERDNLRICIVNHHAPTGKKIIYRSNGSLTEQQTLDFFRKLKKKSSDLTVKPNLLSFADQKWELRVQYIPAALIARHNWHVWFVLVKGILFTGILGGFLLIITGRTSIIESSIALKEEAEKELRQTQKTLIHSEKLSAIGKLSASVAHEFNNPIYGIRNVLESVESDFFDGNSNQSYKKVVSMAIRECDRMADLIKKLQDFHRPSFSKPVLININTVIADTILFCEKRLKARGIVLETIYDDNVPDVEIITDQIKQVLLNLIHNADDAITGESGKITISTEYLEPNVLIHIHDSGAGIPDKDMSTIFEPFFTTKPDVKGTGLGLSICYGIIKRHDGEIKVESEPGRGTTFTIVLPAGN